LDAEILHLQTTIDDLCVKRSELHDYVVWHQAFLTSMRRVLQEILQEIFIRCLPAHHNAIMSCREAPLLLGQVCSLWRSVSISTPRLRSSIHVTIARDQGSLECEMDSPLASMADASMEHGVVCGEAMETWLNRSGTLPLSISLRCRQRMRR
jgi:hypothetical protein